MAPDCRRAAPQSTRREDGRPVTPAPVEVRAPRRRPSGRAYPRGSMPRRVTPVLRPAPRGCEEGSAPPRRRWSLRVPSGGRSTCRITSASRWRWRGIERVVRVARAGLVGHAPRPLSPAPAVLLRLPSRLVRLSSPRPSLPGEKGARCAVPDGTACRPQTSSAALFHPKASSTPLRRGVRSAAPHPWPLHCSFDRSGKE